MATEDHKTLLRHLARAFNTRKLHALEALFSPHFVLHDPRQPLWPAGRTGVRQLWTSLLHTAPDLQLRMEDLVSEGDKVVVRWTFQGTWAHERPGHAPGEPFTAVRIAIYRIANGQIAEDWGIAQPLAPTHPPWH